MGVSPRHTRRILVAYREEGASAVAHGHRGRRSPNATPDAVGNCCGSLGSHQVRRGQPPPSERARGHSHRQDHPAAYPMLPTSIKHTVKGEAYLHNSRTPLAEVDFDEVPGYEDLMLGECEGRCGI